MRNVLPRLLAGLPDAITAGVFLTAWVAPAIAGPERIRNLMLVMLIEFLVVHSSGFYGAILAMDDASRLKRTFAMLGLAAVYMAFVFVFSFIFDSTWPIWAFAWLLGSRFVHLWFAPASDDTATLRMMTLWAISVATYVLGGIATAMLPLPELGITPQVIASLHLKGGGEWIDRPYTVLAFGAIYFAIQGWAKYALSGTDSTQRAAPASATMRDGELS
jgi:hypothetical protein